MHRQVISYWLPMSAGIFALTLLLSGCRQPTAQAPVAPSIRLAADESSAPLAESLLNAYESRVSASVLTLQRSSRNAALTALVSGEVDVVLLVHPLKGQELFNTPVGRAPLFIVAHPDIQVGDISGDDVRAIFAGQVTTWSTVGGPDVPIQVITGARESSDRLAFEALVMGSSAITSAARVAADRERVWELISKTPGGIGYMAGDAPPPPITVLGIDGIPAMLETVLNDKYSLITPVVFVTPQEPEGQLRAFLDWILSDEGQQVVQRHMLRIND